MKSVAKFVHCDVLHSNLPPCPRFRVEGRHFGKRSIMVLRFGGNDCFLTFSYERVH